MKLDRTFYRSWYLVVLSCLWLLFIVGISSETTAGYQSQYQDDGSGEVQIPVGNDTTDAEMTSNETSTASSHNAQDNQIDDHQEILPTDHFIWRQDDLTQAFEEQALLGYVMVEYNNAYSVTQCSDRCLRHVPECRSYNYQEDTHSCQLNSESDLDAPEALHNFTGVTYYRTTVFQTHQVSL